MSPLLLLAAAGGGIYLLTRKKTASNAVTGKSGKPWIVEMLPKGSAGDVYYQLPATSHAYQLSSPAGTFGPHDQVVVLTYRQDGSDMKRALTVLKSRGSTSSTVIREFKISVDGITLGEPIDLGAFRR